MRSREYWDDSFEQRYTELKKELRRPPLKVLTITVTIRIHLLYSDY
jgi:alpha-mannosidase